MFNTLMPSPEIRIWPKVYFYNSHLLGAELNTYVRVAHRKHWYSRKLWYLVNVREITIYLSETSNNEKEKKLESALIRFNIMVYQTLLLHKVDLKWYNSYGESLYKLDPDQCSELERVKSL